jgi:predicted Zn-dependent peptidase
MRVDRSRLPEIGQDPVFSFPSIVHHTVGEGLSVRTVEHRTVPLVTFVLQVTGGSAADPSGKEGIAALTADMIDEGTGALSAIEVSDALARIGAEYDVDVGADATVFSLTTLARFAQRGAALLAEMVMRPSLRESDFERVRQLRLDRLRQLKDVPPAVAERAFLRLMYGTHPYGHIAIGAERPLRAMTLTEVSNFHEATFRPSRATLVIAGAMSHDELAHTAAEAFGGWPGSRPSDTSSPTAADIEPPVLRRPRLTIVPREKAAQSELRIGRLAARRDTPDYAALLVMNAVLGGQFSSRINLKLREEKGYTYGARTGFDWRRGLAPFVLQAGIHTAATADAVRESLQELEAIRGLRPPSESELLLAKASLTRGYPRNFETAQQVARSVAQLTLYELPDSYFEEFTPRVSRVEGSDVLSVAQRYLEPGDVSTLIVGDHTAIADSIGALGLGEPEIGSPEF